MKKHLFIFAILFGFCFVTTANAQLASNPWNTGRRTYSYENKNRAYSYEGRNRAYSFENNAVATPAATGVAISTQAIELPTHERRPIITLPANPWIDDSPIPTPQKKPSEITNARPYDPGIGGVERPNYIGRNTTWGKEYGQERLLPEANLTNAQMMVQHLRDLGYQIPDSYSTELANAPANYAAKLRQSFIDLQNAQDPMSNSVVHMINIFDDFTGLSTENLMFNSIRIMNR